MTINYLIMDVDGTLTNGEIIIGNNGELAKVFNVKDGLGIARLLPPLKIVPVVITGRKSIILENRCMELGVTEIYQGISNKLDILYQLSFKKKCSYGNFAYIGDDINDLDCMRLIKSANGLIGCPRDAAPEVKEISDFIAINPGGHGAVREFINYLGQLL